ncbi:factor H binding family protein [Suttonella sp. R2A3]|uniref:factor H binding family protein n=1 Tax=Suttonella sp. R2A3 TaxID=2908648 RepID=UPI001F2F38B3|nr:factor H binding family protein [Suttonella sp. R2A3]UJF24681.1 factor H binding family protein [Suttonella sp. R2A3]
MRQHLTLTIAMAIVLTACGGGGSSNINDIPQVSNKPTNKIQITNDDYRITLDGEVYEVGKPIDISKLSQQEVHKFTDSVLAGKEEELRGTLLIYKQNYSAIYGLLADKKIDLINGTTESSDEYRTYGESNSYTPKENIPSEGKFNYQGIAFDGRHNNGRLSYQVDFKEKTGSGKIEGLTDVGTVVLQEGKINLNSPSDYSHPKISGAASFTDLSGSIGDTYSLRFMGPNAEEIVGSAYTYKNTGEYVDVSFAGETKTKTTE